MFSIIATHDKTSFGINTYLADTFDELSQIKTKPGSKAYVIEDGKTYILKHNGQWHEYYSALKVYVDSKFETLDISPEILEELRLLVDQIENGNINQLIVDKIKELDLVSSADVEIILQEKNYISYNNIEKTILYGGSATEI